MMELRRRIGRHFAGGGEEGGHRDDREREKKGAGETHFDEMRKGQDKNIAQERKDLWEVWTASPPDALKIFKEEVEAGRCS